MEEVIKKIYDYSLEEILGERFILIENQLDKLNPNKEFNTELFFYNHLKEIISHTQLCTYISNNCPGDYINFYY